MSIPLDMAYLTGLLAVFVRLSAFIVSCSSLFPLQRLVTIQLLVAFAIAVGIRSVVPAALGVASLSGLVIEALIGIFFGVVINMATLAGQMMGEVADGLMGLSFSQLFDPSTQQERAIIGQLYHILTTLLMLAMNVHHLAIGVLVKSFEVNALDLIGGGEEIVWHLVGRINFVLNLGIVLALPVTISLLSTHLFISFLSRIAPALNIWGIGFILMLSVGIIGQYMSLEPVLSHVALLVQAQFDYLMEKVIH